MSNLDMKEAIKMLAAEKNISEETLLQVLVEALATAYKRRPGSAEEVEVGLNTDTLEISFTAFDIDEDGNWVNQRDDTPDKNELGRIAAQTFRQVMGQRIREAERDKKFEEYANREGDIVTGIIQQNDHRYALLDLGKVEALMPQSEQVPFERATPGTRMKAYIVEVRRSDKGPQIVVSRTHPGLVKRLFELEVPEIADGVVEIKACAREPGHRTKIAVFSNEDRSQADVIVPDFQLSLAIGKEGQNARLAARLAGVRIDIKSETQHNNELNGIFEDAEYADGEWVLNAETGAQEFHAADGSVMSVEEWEKVTSGITAVAVEDEA